MFTHSHTTEFENSLTQKIQNNTTNIEIKYNYKNSFASAPNFELVN